MKSLLLEDEYHTAPENIANQYLLIVSEVRFLREGISDALKGNSKLNVAGLCDNLGQALAAVRGRSAATILLDAAFPNGLDALRQIRAADASACIVVFAVSETEENVITWAKAGAAGYIPTTAALSELVRFVECIIRGEQICSASMASRLIRRIGSSASLGRDSFDLHFATSLTTREHEIMRMISEGLSNKEIARELRIELSTTKSHVHNILGKLRLQRRGQVAQWARKQESRLS
jgi:DNA-binding NarL/FixJ family response regulator